MLPLSSCDIFSVVSQCRILATVQYMNTQLFAFFFDWRLALAGLHSDLVTVDVEWHRLNLLSGSRRTSLEAQTQIWTWLRQERWGCVVHQLYTAYKQCATGFCCCVYQWLTKPCHSHQPMLGWGRRRNRLNEIFKKLPDENMMHIVKMTLRILLAANWKLSTTVHVFSVMPGAHKRDCHCSDFQAGITWLTNTGSITNTTLRCLLWQRCRCPCRAEITNEQ